VIQRNEAERHVEGEAQIIGVRRIAMATEREMRACGAYFGMTTGRWVNEEVLGWS
jgi:hypothetical protein